MWDFDRHFKSSDCYSSFKPRGLSRFSQLTACSWYKKPYQSMTPRLLKEHGRKKKKTCWGQKICWEAPYFNHCSRNKNLNGPRCMAVFAGRKTLLHMLLHLQISCSLMSEAALRKELPSARNLSFKKKKSERNRPIRIPKSSGNSVFFGGDPKEYQSQCQSMAAWSKMILNTQAQGIQSSYTNSTAFWIATCEKPTCRPAVQYQ